MNYEALLDEVSRYVRQCFDNPELSGLAYHNLAHTRKVVERTEEIGRHYALNEQDWFVVMTAAWFHDVGYVMGEADGHELRSALLAADFLQEREPDAQVHENVRNCIMATVSPQKPQNLLEEIVCDADLYHFGTKDFWKMNKLMRRESEWRIKQPIDKGGWRYKTIQLLESHEFKTRHCRHLLQEGKADNIKKLKEKAMRDIPFVPILPIERGSGPGRKKKKIKKKSDRPDKGIETMFRVSSSNHQRLSDMADNKANIMITTTSIIISVLLSVVVGRLETNFLNVPNIILLTVCVVTMVFSILATRPTIPDGLFTPEEVDNKQVNLLFFGNFYRMSYEDYSQSMMKVMADRDFLYGSLTRDVYSQGVVLGRKYRLLRIAYSTFMFGIVISVIAFIASSILYGQTV